MRICRVVCRVALVLAVSAVGAVEFLFLRILGRIRSSGDRARWQGRTSRRYLRVLNVHTRVVGRLPETGMLACNHLSYVDILVVGNVVPTTFVSKHEVKRWPIFGALARMGGTLFLQRAKKAHARELAAEFDRIIDGGAMLGLFPEGASSDGTTVLPFFSALFQPAAEKQWNVSPVWIGYSLPDGGSVRNDVCFIDDMLFAPHFLRLLSHERIDAAVCFGDRAPGGLNRKELARWLRGQVLELSAGRGGKTSATLLAEAGTDSRIPIGATPSEGCGV